MGENDIKRADRDVALSIAITLVLAAYRLLISFSLRIDAMVGHHLVDGLMNALFFWLLFMLWLAYRRWRKVSCSATSCNASSAASVPTSSSWSIVPATSNAALEPSSRCSATNPRS